MAQQCQRGTWLESMVGGKICTMCTDVQCIIWEMGVSEGNAAADSPPMLLLLLFAAANAANAGQHTL